MSRNRGAIRLALLGSTGRMGRHVRALLESGPMAERFELVAQPGRKDPLDSVLGAEVVVDFALPEAMSRVAKDALDRLHRNPQTTLPAFVLASTGWSTEGRKLLDELARKAPVLLSSNYSTGVLALRHLLGQAAPLLRELGYEAAITETHHRHKKDAPSGTAILLQQAVTESTQGKLQAPIHSIRAGEVIGDHEVRFFGRADQLWLGHHAQDRSLFAQGALDAALWIAERREYLPPRVLSADDFFRDRYLSTEE